MMICSAPKPLCGNDTAQTHGAIANHGDLLTLAHARRNRRMTPGPHEIRQSLKWGGQFQDLQAAKARLMWWYRFA
jgi:hypothetical protein